MTVIRTPAPTAPGQPIVIDETEVATVWSPGPKAGTVWGLSEDGTARVFTNPTSHYPHFTDTGRQAPERSAAWQTMLATVTAGRTLVVTTIGPRPWRHGVPQASGPLDVTVHVSTCTQIGTGDGVDLDSTFWRLDRFGGAAALEWLHREEHGKTGLTRTVIEQGAFCSCVAAAQEHGAAAA